MSRPVSRWMISPEQLRNMPNDDIVIVDCRFSLQDTDEGERLYRQAHISGAVYLHLDRDLSGEKGAHGGRHPLPEVKDIEKRLQAIGVGKDTLVVAYDDSRFAFASRLWWLLRYLGHDQVKVLEGGFQAWQQVGLSVDSDEPRCTTGTFTATVRDDMAVDINTVKTIPLLPSAVLIDSRERPRFIGQEEPIDPIAGHINGAVNFPWQQATNELAQLHEPAQQRERWGEVLEQEDIVCYCGSGVTACVNLLSLAELGREDAQLYVGSWSDWCSYLAL